MDYMSKICLAGCFVSSAAKMSFSLLIHFFLPCVYNYFSITQKNSKLFVLVWKGTIHLIRGSGATNLFGVSRGSSRVLFDLIVYFCWSLFSLRIRKRRFWLKIKNESSPSFEWLTKYLQWIPLLCTIQDGEYETSRICIGWRRTLGDKSSFSRRTIDEQAQSDIANRTTWWSQSIFSYRRRPSVASSTSG